MKTAKRNSKGVTPPQQGRIVRAHKPAEVSAGKAPQANNSGSPGMKGIRAGAPPQDVAQGPAPASIAAEANVRKGTDPHPPVAAIYQGLPASGVKGGAAPTMPASGRQSLVSDRDNQMEQTGRRGYAKGGKVKGGDRDADDHAYAKGGKVSRNSPVGEFKGAAGNGGIPGVASNIPLAQPGGTPSTGVTASGSMEPSYAGASTPQLRSAPISRTGKAPSLPRPRR